MMGGVSRQESVDLELRREVREAMEALARFDLVLQQIEGFSDV